MSHIEDLFEGARGYADLMPEDRQEEFLDCLAEIEADHGGEVDRANDAEREVSDLERDNEALQTRIDDMDSVADRDLGELSGAIRRGDRFTAEAMLDRIVRDAYGSRSIETVEQARFAQAVPA